MAPNNPLNSWGNDKTMNLNTLILTNIQSSPYFKVQLFELKTFHEVVDEIYYKVDHLEPWEKGSRKTAGQTGMCGGVRGVGAGGIVSSAYCLLFKLFTLKLTKKQVNNLITHSDSPFIRGLGFMYIRYSQPPGELWDWYEAYLDDDEELDVKAGGGHMMTIGEMLRQWLVKLEWYSTLFPRIPVPIQKDLDVKLRSRPVVYGFSGYGQEQPKEEPKHIPDDQVSYGEAERSAQNHRGGYSGKGQEEVSNGNYSRRSPPVRRRSPPPRRSPNSRSDFSRDLERERDRQRREKEKDRPRDREDKRRSRSRSRDRRASRSRSGDRLKEEKEYRDRPKEEKEYRDRPKEEKEYRDRLKEEKEYRDRPKEEKEYRKDKDYKREKEHKKKSHKHSKEKSRGKDRTYDRDISRDRERSKESDRLKEKVSHRSRERDRSRDRERSYKKEYDRENHRIN